MKRIIIKVSGLVLLLTALTAAASVQAKNNLERFFSEVRTYSARFDQVVLDEGMNTLQESSGRLWIVRPGKFRWDYDKPFRQEIVGDGEQVWSYDIELQQITVRPMHGALGYTPAMLMSGKGKLKENFEVEDIGKQGSLQWMKMLPKKKDGGFEVIRVGFEEKKLRVLEMVDGFGQTTRLTLSGAIENKKIKDSKFKFKPPKGVDVVYQ